MNNNGPTEDSFFQNLNSLTAEEFLMALTYDFERHANSISGWATILSKGCTEETLEQAVQSLNWNADHMKRLINETRNYLKKNEKQN